MLFFAMQISRQIKLLFTSILLLSLFNFSTCKYSFKDTSPIPQEVKTFRVNYFENKAQYVNTQLSPQLTERLKTKIINTTRLKQTNDDDAHYDISGFITQYFTSTVSISGTNASGNRLTVGFHLVFRNSLDEKKNMEADLMRTFDFDATQSLTQAESTLNEQIVRNIVDEIFNKIFSNW
ncbi:MAG: LPS assembly lipoprotein LptE [Ferruginibacter sp.]